MHTIESASAIIPYVRPAGEETDKLGEIIKKRKIGFGANWDEEKVKDSESRIRHAEEEDRVLYFLRKSTEHLFD